MAKRRYVLDVSKEGDRDRVLGLLMGASASYYMLRILVTVHTVRRGLTDGSDMVLIALLLGFMGDTRWVARPTGVCAGRGPAGGPSGMWAGGSGSPKGDTSQRIVDVWLLMIVDDENHEMDDDV